jgi:hypothetical protein
MDHLIQTQIPTNRSRFIYRDLPSYFFEICSNPIYYEKLAYYELAEKETLTAAKEMTKNMTLYSNRNKSNVILRIGFEVGGSLLNRMWVPKKVISDLVEYYAKTVFKDYFMIGIQLRYHYINDNVDTNTFFKCAFMIESNMNNSKLNDTVLT